LAKKKARAVFVDLTAAYKFISYRGITCKLLCDWYLAAGPALSRLDRLLPIGPCAKGGPALHLL